MLTSRFAHIHIPRTGGSTLRTFLDRIPGAVVISQMAHLPYESMRQACVYWGYSMPPAFAFIRHPCSWYVSQWCWLSHIGQAGLAGVSFAEFMERVEPNPAIRPLTIAWRAMGADKCQYVGRFENYQDEVVRILRAIIPDLITEVAIRAKIQAAGHYRRAPRPDGQLAGAWRQYYNDTRLAQVAKWDGDLMESFGYKI